MIWSPSSSFLCLRCPTSPLALTHVPVYYLPNQCLLPTFICFKKSVCLQGIYFLHYSISPFIFIFYLINARPIAPFNGKLQFMFSLFTHQLLKKPTHSSAYFGTHPQRSFYFDPRPRYSGKNASYKFQGPNFSWLFLELLHFLLFCVFFLSGFSFTIIHDSQDSRKRRRLSV